MYHWKKFNETLPEKIHFYSKLNMEDNADADYMQKDFAKICKSLS